MLFILEDNDERIAGFKDALGDRACHVERTVPQAIAWLQQYKDEVTLYSLDNDLVLLDYDGDEGEGWQLCEWMLAHARKAPVICHTTNSHAGHKMKFACSDAGWAFHRVVPYNDCEWIEETWIRTVKEILCQ